MSVAVLSPSGETAKRMITPRVGTARPTLARLIASAPPRPRWPSPMPTGSAIRQAMSTDAADSQTCSHSRCRIPSSPCQLAAVVSQLHTVMSASLNSAPRPGWRAQYRCARLRAGQPAARSTSLPARAPGPRARSHRDRPGPGGEQSLHEQEDQVEDDREQHHQHDAGEHLLPVEIVLEAGGDDPAEANVPDREADRHQ